MFETQNSICLALGETVHSQGTEISSTDNIVVLNFLNMYDFTITELLYLCYVINIQAYDFSIWCTIIYCHIYALSLVLSSNSGTETSSFLLVDWCLSHNHQQVTY